MGEAAPGRTDADLPHGLSRTHEHPHVRPGLPSGHRDHTCLLGAALRLHEARRMFELTDASVETIAEQCGFGSAVTLRQNFSSAFATTPAEYRRHFRARPRVEPQSSGSP